MSKIIKAAELKVLVTDDTDTVIPAICVERDGLGVPEGTLLDGSNLIQDAKRQAQEIVLQAEEEAQLRLAKAAEEVETLRLKAKEEGYAQGYEEGLVEGKEKALQEAEDLLRLLQSTVEEGVRLRVSGLAALEEDFLKLSLLLADKMVRKTIADDVSWLESIIKEALQSLGNVREIVVYVNPMDYSLIKEQEKDLFVTAKANVVFQQDTSVSQGGCLIESENGLIDARLEQRLGKLGKSLMEVLYDENNR